MGALGKRKPSSAPAGKKAARRAPSPDSESASGQSSSDDGVEDDAIEDGEEDASEEGEPSMSPEDDADEGDESDDRDSDEEEGSSSLDELDDEAFGGDDLELDERAEVSSDSDDDSDGAGDDAFEDDAFDDDDDDDDFRRRRRSRRRRCRPETKTRRRGRVRGGGARRWPRGGVRVRARAGNPVGDAAKAPSSGGAEICPRPRSRGGSRPRRASRSARGRGRSGKSWSFANAGTRPRAGVVNPASDKLERRMLQTATRGVVRLFNAVSKAQKAAADAGKRKGGTLKPKELTKGSFLAELKKSGERERAEAKKEEKKEEKGGGRGWDVLSDGYLMGRNKLKDWDKGTRTAEEEVEYEDDDFD